VRVENDVVVASSSMGEVRVTLPSGETVHNPMRARRRGRHATWRP
jgi:hypothetical protein